MNEETQRIVRESNNGSHVFSVSVRAWIVMIIVVTVCAMSLLAMEIKEPLYTLVGLTVGYYFGQNKKQESKP